MSVKSVSPPAECGINPPTTPTPKRAWSDQGHTQLPNPVLRRAMSVGLNVSLLLYLTGRARHKQGDPLYGCCWPGVAEIMAEIGLPRKKLRADTDALAANGFIAVRHWPSGDFTELERGTLRRHLGKAKTHNVYTISHLTESTGNQEGSKLTPLNQEEGSNLTPLKREEGSKQEGRGVEIDPQTISIEQDVFLNNKKQKTATEEVPEEEASKEDQSPQTTAPPAIDESAIFGGATTLEILQGKALAELYDRLIDPPIRVPLLAAREAIDLLRMDDGTPESNITEYGIILAMDEGAKKWKNYPQLHRPTAHDFFRSYVYRDLYA